MTDAAHALRFQTQRAREIPFSSIRKVFESARRMESEGMDVARMEIGRPDFDTPEHVKVATKEALDAGHVHYAPNRGIEALRATIARKLADENDVDVDPANGVVVTVGCKEAIALTMLAYVEAGDEVLIPDPCWDTYVHTTRFVGGTPVPVPLRPENGYVLDPNEVERRITERTKILVLVSPSNPTGAVHGPDVLKELARIAEENDLLVVSDEIYEKLLYGAARHLAIASLPGMADRTITINGFSKAYAMDGWRIGYAAGADALVDPLVKVHQYTTNCVPTFLQYGAIAAYDGPQDALDRMRQEFDRRRAMLVARLRAMTGVSVLEPEGAFYVFPRIDGTELSGADLAARVLDEARVACVPGDVFGAAGEGHLRLSYATSYDSIAAGMDRLHAVLERWHGAS